MTEKLTSIIFVTVNTDMRKWDLTQRDRWKIEVNKDIWTRPRRQYTVVHHYSLLLLYHSSWIINWLIWATSICDRYDNTYYMICRPIGGNLSRCQSWLAVSTTEAGLSQRTTGTWHWWITLLQKKQSGSHYMLMLATIRLNSCQSRWEVKFDENIFFKGAKCPVVFFHLSWLGKGCQVSKLLY